MMASTHRLGGLAAGIALSIALAHKPEEAMLITDLSILGSLLPDIDNGNSSISCNLPLTRLVVAIGQSTIRFICHFLPKKLRKPILCSIGHRGFSHSILGIAFFFFLTAGICRSIGVEKHITMLAASAISVGVASHIVLDMLSGGSPLFCPVSTIRITLARIKTGGVMEWVFRMVFLVVIICRIAIIASSYINEIVAEYLSPYILQVTRFFQNLTF